MKYYNGTWTREGGEREASPRGRGEGAGPQRTAERQTNKDIGSDITKVKRPARKHQTNNASQKLSGNIIKKEISEGYFKSNSVALITNVFAQTIPFDRKGVQWNFPK